MSVFLTQIEDAPPSVFSTRADAEAYRLRMEEYYLEKTGMKPLIYVWEVKVQ